MAEVGRSSRTHSAGQPRLPDKGMELTTLTTPVRIGASQRVSSAWRIADGHRQAEVNESCTSTTSKS